MDSAKMRNSESERLATRPTKWTARTMPVAARCTPKVVLSSAAPQIRELPSWRLELQITTALTNLKELPVVRRTVSVQVELA
jgi:hypothetical protein